MSGNTNVLLKFVFHSFIFFLQNSWIVSSARGDQCAVTDFASNFKKFLSVRANSEISDSS